MNNKTILAIPVFLILIMSFIFRYVSVKYGVTVAILLGFLIYQIIWCMVIPLSILQKQALFSIFIQKEKLFTYKNTLYITSNSRSDSFIYFKHIKIPILFIFYWTAFNYCKWNFRRNIMERIIY